MTAASANRYWCCHELPHCYLLQIVHLCPLVSYQVAVIEPKTFLCHSTVGIAVALSSPQCVSLSHGLPEGTSEALAQQQLNSQSPGYEHTGPHVLKWQQLKAKGKP